MSETATIASSNSGGRPALDLTETIPLTRTPNIRLLGGAAAAITTTTHESFLLCEKFIYATSCTPSTAVYHISTRNTRSGKPWQLALSRLLPSETRLLSSTSSSSPPPLIKYDDDLTLYTGEKLAVPISIGQKPLLCIRGRAGGSSSSSTIIAEKTLGRSRTYKFWRMTPIRRPLNKAEEDRMQTLMHKRGYRTSDDWRKELVYTAQQGRAGGAAAATTEWTDERGVVVARESDGQLVMGGAEAVGASARDLLVACWASRNFVQSSPENESTIT
ncbi:hypothetical protein BBO_06994 [Beauveria brongniartii RCEF 3172]|uniref:Uncharacterized protein n=1 Tax=Beauveria brongniartii RCEF 3172 TaxID=1081107 RepID=A0A167ABP4_9HYPO|nr:hypothetical protein BBO_06994 [Beauveria brongniartii RCEF 3172]